MQKKTFLLNMILLTATTLLTRAIGIAFRIYMSNKIGTEGIGLFQLVCTVYLFCANFASTGMSITVTRLVTDSVAEKNYAKAKAYTKKCLILSVTASFIIAFLMFFGADFIGYNLLNDKRTILSMKILAPSLPFMSVSSCFRGYFYAVRKVIKTSSEQLLDQIVEIAVFALLIGFLAPKGLEWACCAIVIGTTVAEIISFIYSLILYLFDIKRYPLDKLTLCQKKSYKKIASICIPITLSYCLRSGLSMIENILIPTGFKKAGASSSKSLSIYGMITGMVMPVIVFPAVILYSFSMLLIPEISEANAVNHKKNISYIATKVFNITVLYSIMVSGIMLFFSKELGFIIYGNKEIGMYIGILAPIIPLMYLDSVVDGMLKGLGEQSHYLLYNIIDSILRVVLIYVLIPSKGIIGLIFVLFFSTILNSSLSIARLIKVANLKLDIINIIIKPILLIFVSCFTLKTLLKYELFIFSSAISDIIFKICLSVFLYGALMLITKAVTKNDLLWIKNCFNFKHSNKSYVSSITNTI